MISVLKWIGLLTISLVLIGLFQYIALLSTIGILICLCIMGWKIRKYTKKGKTNDNNK